MAATFKTLLAPAAVALFAVLGPALGSAPEQPVHVEIRAQGLSSALTEFGRETATEIVFAPQTVANLSSAAVDGDYPRLAALQQLLQGTGLRYRLTAQGVVVVEAPASARVANNGTQPTAPSSHAAVDTLTVEATRQREAVKLEIPTFVSAITVHSHDESLATWQIPICPLVAGLPQEAGEFVLWRISQAALEASAPLAPQDCRPNFLLVVTKNPGKLLNEWHARHRNAFNESRGIAPIKRVINSDQPIRIWYNVDDGCPGTITYDIAVNAGRHGFPFPSCSRTGGMGSHLTWEIVRVISSVIILADADRIKGLNIGQLADYVTMVGMAQIRMEKDPGAAPTILRLFTQDSAERQQSMSPWDKAFLKALYNTYPNHIVQVSQMQTKMLEYLMN